MIEIQILIALAGLLLALVFPAYVKHGPRYALLYAAALVGGLAALVAAAGGIVVLLGKLPGLRRAVTAVIATVWYGFLGFLVLGGAATAILMNFTQAGAQAQDRLLDVVAAGCLAFGGLVHSEKVPGLKRGFFTFLIGAVASAGFFFALFFVTVFFLSAASPRLLWTATALELAFAAAAGFGLVIGARHGGEADAAAGGRNP
jgi:hypothetical protein